MVENTLDEREENNCGYANVDRPVPRESIDRKDEAATAYSGPTPRVTPKSKSAYHARNYV